jgi:hypothetical protein
MYRVPSLPDAGPERAPRPFGRAALRRAALVAFGVAALVACDDPGVEPGPQGALRVTLISPNGNEGAALFELPIDGVLEVKAPVGALVEARTGGRRQVAVFASQPTPITLQLTVADQTRPPEVRLLQVSGPEDQPRALAGYRVQIEVPR